MPESLLHREQALRMFPSSATLCTALEGDKGWFVTHAGFAPVEQYRDDAGNHVWLHVLARAVG
jgi:hypothetical protein